MSGTLRSDQVQIRAYSDQTLNVKAAAGFPASVKVMVTNKFLYLNFILLPVELCINVCKLVRCIAIVLVIKSILVMIIHCVLFVKT